MAQAKFKTGAIDHTALIGIDYYHFKSKFFGLYSNQEPTTIIDL